MKTALSFHVNPVRMAVFKRWRPKFPNAGGQETLLVSEVYMVGIMERVR